MITDYPSKATTVESELIDELYAEIARFRKEAQKWRNDYHMVRAMYNTLNTEYLVALRRINEDADKAARNTVSDGDY